MDNNEITNVVYLLGGTANLRPESKGPAELLKFKHDSKREYDLELGYTMRTSLFHPNAFNLWARSRGYLEMDDMKSHAQGENNFRTGGRKSGPIDNIVSFPIGLYHCVEVARQPPNATLYILELHRKKR